MDAGGKANLTKCQGRSKSWCCLKCVLLPAEVHDLDGGFPAKPPVLGGNRI
jgi:hypothetical protein